MDSWDSIVEGIYDDGRSIQQVTNPCCLIDKIRMTLPCPVDMVEVYNDVVYELDTSDYRQLNLSLCVYSGLTANKYGHFEVGDEIMWTFLPDHVSKPNQSKAFHVPHTSRYYSVLEDWIFKAKQMDGRINLILDTVDANIANLRTWRQVRRHWPDFSNSLLACMDEKAAADWVGFVFDRVSKAHNWYATMTAGAGRERHINKKARDRVTNAIQAGLLLPEKEIEAWQGYRYAFGRRDWP